MAKILSAAVAVSMLLSSITGAFAIGAIAVDDDAGSSPTAAGYGYSVDHSSKDEATAAAVKECKKAGNDSCKAVVWFETCGAYSSSREKYGIGYGASEAAATSQAMKACGAGCKLVVSVCE